MVEMDEENLKLKSQFESYHEFFLKFLVQVALPWHAETDFNVG